MGTRMIAAADQLLTLLKGLNQMIFKITRQPNSARALYIIFGRADELLRYKQQKKSRP